MKKVFSRLKKVIQPISRDKKQNQFYSFFKEKETVLDIGVHSENKDSPDSANHFIKTFRYNPSNYTGLGIEKMDYVRKKYPDMEFVEYPGGTFPFESNRFDWAYSNAVIEHVGDIQTKIKFISEMCRVAKNVFFTTPNKFFPIDAHTMVWFLHWNESKFLKWREKNGVWWPQEKLNLISYSELQYLLEQNGVKEYTIKRNRLFGLTMTFSVIIRDSGI